jgi:hypothetical protein
MEQNNVMMLIMLTMITVKTTVIILSVETQSFGTKVMEHKLVMMETPLSMIIAQIVN